MNITKDDVGKKLWDVLGQEWVEIVYNTESIDYLPVKLLKTNQTAAYCNAEGKENPKHNAPRYYWDKVEIVEPPKPRKTKTVKGWMGVKNQSGYFRVFTDVYPSKEDVVQMLLNAEKYVDTQDYLIQEVEYEFYDD
jgi:hypothetical protein